MKNIRRIAVFPFEVLLMAVVAIYVASDFAGHALGKLCRWVEGEQ